MFLVTGHSKATLVLRALDRISADPSLLLLLNDDLNERVTEITIPADLQSQLEWAKGVSCLYSVQYVTN